MRLFQPTKIELANCKENHGSQPESAPSGDRGMKLSSQVGLDAAKLAGIGTCCLVVLAYGGQITSCYVQDLMQLRNAACEAVMQDGMILIIILAYMLLISFPFVPGAEIGFALLVIFGAEMAVVLYFATIVALMFSFCIGRLAPACLLERIFARLGFTRIAQLLSANRFDTYSLSISSVRTGLVAKCINWLLRHRCCALAVLINTPGNTLMGGGGGIALAAGVSRLVTLREFLISVSLAVAPVPLIMVLSALI